MAVLFRLRYRATDFDVPLREDFVVGRSPSANLTLEDGLVSRRHGLFRMAGNTLLVEDLKSRNGVMVNGERIESPRSLSHLDRVSIGSQDLIVIRVEASNAEMPLTKRTLTAIEIGDPPTEAFSLQEPSEVTRNAQAFDLLRGIAEKSMFMNRFDEAERILRSPLRGLLTRALRDSTKPEEFDEAVNFALELAKGLSEPKWITWVFDVHCAYRVVPA
ncbi:MAG: FHA domain-containing protein [Myxococcota bacterium]